MNRIHAYENDRKDDMIGNFFLIKLGNCTINESNNIILGFDSDIVFLHTDSKFVHKVANNCFFDNLFSSITTFG